MRYTGVVFLLLCLLVSCTGRKGVSDVEPAHVVPLYDMFADGLVNYSLADSDSVVLAAFMRTVSEQELSPELIETWESSQPVAVFTPDVDSVFADSMFVPDVLGYILDRAEAGGLALPKRRYATVVYGRPESVLFVDSVMLIALNHYLGSDYAGYSHWPEYMVKNKTPQALPYDIAEALVATSYPYALDGENATLLSKMVYEGVIAHAKLLLVPEATAAGALGYTNDEMKWLADNERNIWQSLVKWQLLYDTSENISDRLIAPSPEVTLTVPSAPGRVGRYIGYRIVEDYLADKPQMKLNDMLLPEFYKGNAVLVSSNFGNN